MLNSEFYDYVLRRSRRAGDTVLRADAVLEFPRILSSWERSPFHPWFLEKVSSGLVTVADTQTISRVGTLYLGSDSFVSSLTSYPRFILTHVLPLIIYLSLSQLYPL